MKVLESARGGRVVCGSFTKLRTVQGLQEALCMHCFAVGSLIYGAWWWNLVCLPVVCR